MSISKDKYRIYCSKEASIPLFARDWWLDAAAGINGWDVAICEVGGQIRASLPYSESKVFGFTVLTNPPFTRSLGPWIERSDAKLAKRHREQKKLMNDLIDQLPPYHHYVQRWHIQTQNWLPFFWQGFQQTTRYTYLLPDLSDVSNLQRGLLESVKTDLKKSKNRNGIEVFEDQEIDNLWHLSSRTFERQRLAIPYSRETLNRIHSASVSKGCGKIFSAKDPEGRVHAAVFIVWDEKCAYYLVGGGDPELRSSGATSLCLWDAILHSATVTKQFDFEGSMLEPVERFFRSFGGEQRTYFSVTKTNSKLLRFRKGFLDMFQ